jgi:hypothetical protein
MERIRPKTNSQVPEKVRPPENGATDHDKKGKFTKGNLASVGNPGNSKPARKLTQMLTSCLNEEVTEYIKDAKGNPTKTKAHIVRMRKTIEALWQLSVGWNGEKPDLDAIKYLFDRVDGPLPKVTEVEPTAPGDQTFRFTLRVGQQHMDGTRTAAEIDVGPPKHNPLTIDGFNGELGGGLSGDDGTNEF